MSIQGLTPYHARMVAWNIDYNKSGVIDRRELKFKNNSKRMVDLNRNGRVETEELAQALMRGDVYVSNNRKAYPVYRNPGYSRPGFGFGRPSHPYNPPYSHQPPMPQTPGYPYSAQSNHGNQNSFGGAVGRTVVGAGVGAGAGYLIQGPSGVGVGAAVGGLVGLVSNLFD